MSPERVTFYTVTIVSWKEGALRLRLFIIGSLFQNAGVTAASFWRREKHVCSSKTEGFVAEKSTFCGGNFTFTAEKLEPAFERRIQLCSDKKKLKK